MAACARARARSYAYLHFPASLLSPAFFWHNRTEGAGRGYAIRKCPPYFTYRSEDTRRGLCCASRARVSTACLYIDERKKEGKKGKERNSRDTFFLYSRIFFEISPIVCLYSMFQRAWRDIRFGIGSVEILSKIWLISIRVLNIEENVKGEREKKKYVLLVYLYSSLRMEF